MKTINNYNVKKKKVLFRADLNAPTINNVIIEKSRITSIKSSSKKLIDKKNKIFLISHFGRPKGKYTKKLSIEFMLPIIAKELEIENIYFIKSFNNQEIEETLNRMKFGDVCLFENVRFYKGEEINDLKFAKELSKNFDIYVNDAFSASHREHASVVGVTQFLPSIAGDSLLEEIKNLELFVHNPQKPNTAIIGGSKISTKIRLIQNLIEHFDNIVIGGAMANTFLFAEGFNIGKSLIEKELAYFAKELLTKAKNFNCNIILPVDVVCSNNLKNSAKVRHCKITNILHNQMIFDLGNKSIQKIIETLLRSNMILWNGPVGAYEYKPFNYASIKIAKAIKRNTKLLKIISLAGGGDTIAVIKMAKAGKGFTYVSNAGGAFLEWFEGKESPGVKAIKENKLS